MKSHSIIHFLGALLYNILIASLLTAVSGAPLLFTATATIVGGVCLGAVNEYAGIKQTGLFHADLLKEIWINRLMEKFYPPDSFMSRCVDMTEFVDYNTINLADAGIDPEVLINNTTYPIEIEEREDTPLALPLDYMDTKNTVVRNALQKQLAYSQIDSVIRGHKNALRLKCSGKAIHNWTPSADGANTPVTSTTGAARIDGSGFKQMTLADIARQQVLLDLLDVPAEGRILVLHPKHRQELISADSTLFKAFSNLRTGEVLPLYGFDVYSSRLTPKFNYSTGAKVAYGAAAAGTDSEISLIYHEGEVMKADGGVDMFSRLADPEARGDIIGFQKRFVGLSIRSKFAGVIFSYHA